MARRPKEVAPEPEDPTGWLIDSGFAEFLLLNTYMIKYMCMFGYTFLHGCKLYSKLESELVSRSYKFISLVLACTGGGTLVPIILNSIPVALSVDAYAIAILASFLVHEYVPILREVLNHSNILKAGMIVMYETLRASVVVKFTAAAGILIAPSDFSIPIFGPIVCGAIGGCGGAFMPLNKGLEPIKADGLAQPMVTAFIAAAFYHLFNATSISDGVIGAEKKSQVLIATFFIATNLYASKVIGELPSSRSTLANESASKKKN
ncbi:hypothetical protein MPSEU_000143200 [Mayamaea pseudoterrestris]|nr:hypothetical protein MPSEU_000143200 [Mayamaea pseudoterrestris]